MEGVSAYVIILFFLLLYTLSLYLAARHQKGNSSGTPSGAITYSQQWLCEQWVDWACVCVSSSNCCCHKSSGRHTVTHTWTNSPSCPMLYFFLRIPNLSFSFLQLFSLVDDREEGIYCLIRCSVSIEYDFVSLEINSCRSCTHLILGKGLKKYIYIYNQHF